MIESINKVINRIEEIRRKINTYYYFAIDATTSFKEILDSTTQAIESKTQKSILRHQSHRADQFNPLIERYSKKYNLDPALVRAVIEVESNFNPWAVSPAGAKGLMQLMPQTAKELGVKDIFDPEENIAAGTRYLRQMIDRFNDLSLGLAAYNAGPERVEKSGGIPNILETQNYVKKVLSLYGRT